MDLQEMRPAACEQSQLITEDKQCDRSGPKHVSSRILIVKGSNFLINIYILYKKLKNVIHKIEKRQKIFDMYIVLFSSQNIQNITD